jgi:hypothetical protein
MVGQEMHVETDKVFVTVICLAGEHNAVSGWLLPKQQKFVIR